uniref:high choriolytic enzyme 1-like isoform X2 n=1 Tax=Ciona intestinalis TaxID=7719 RepID=UPI00089DABCD|nr:high choriolytic enzyme 1-like isoform X2 [Ciona intestinalis]|eukprot:XP_002126824.2 high choriolytic enzyme 1-like isoform X2 [Ciona intestinalis]
MRARYIALLLCLDMLLTFAPTKGTGHSIESKCSFNSAECTDDCGPLGHQTDEWDCPISCECKSSGFIEGDIKFDKHNIPMIRKAYSKTKNFVQNGVTNVLDLWTNRVNGRIKVPFVTRNDISAIADTAIYEAVAAISGSTCIDFINRTTEVDFIEVIPGTGCWSLIGRRGGKQELSIGPGCEYSGIVQHELLHALGFWHEQSRPDRDDYVTIRLENILNDKLFNFEKRTTINSLGSPYDIQSIMHYSGYAFTKNGSPTILNRATNQPIITQRNVLTTEDNYELNSLYGCVPLTTVVRTTTTTTSKAAGGGGTSTCLFTSLHIGVISLGTTIITFVLFV